MFKPVPFGRYTLLDRLAIGGMAEIYLARLGIEPRLLVIKRMLPNFAEDKDFVDMFIDEAKISATLDHPNIVPVLDLGRVSDDPFIAMEYVPGKDLQAILNVLVERQTQLGPDHVAFIGQEMMRGLAYAHTKSSPAGHPLNIVHRDISPQNILCSFEGEVKITDFGIAKAESKLNKTQAGILKGKFAYMSPEQVMGREIDARHDIFSAGIILYELSAGHRLFTGKVEWEILQKVRLGHIEPLTDYNPNVPKSLQKIIYRALTVDRERRYENAEEMEIDLVQYLGRYHPTYSHAELAGLMQNLFEQDMQAHRERVHAAISTLKPSAKAERGAKLEATVPGVGDSKNQIKALGSGPHAVTPDLNRVIAQKLGTNPNARMPSAPPRRHPTDDHMSAPSKRGVSLWLVVGLLAAIAVAVGALAAMQPAWLVELIKGATPTQTAAPTGTTQPTVAITSMPATPTATATPVVAIDHVRLKITSVPVAEVFIDGESRGMTPVTVEDLNENQRYQISVTKDGYRTSSRPWFSEKGETALEFQLEKMTADEQSSATPVAQEPGFLTVHVANGTARVFVDGALATSSSPLIKYKLPPGSYDVKVINPTTGDFVEFTARITAGSTFTKRVRL